MMIKETKTNLPIDEALYEQGYNQAIKYLDNFDWQAFRREAAKEMLPITSNWKLTKAGGTASIPISKEAACKLAISYADELIKQLKMGERMKER